MHDLGENYLESYAGVNGDMDLIRYPYFIELGICVLYACSFDSRTDK